MATGLEEKLNLILAEKEEKILPENIKQGVTIFGVEGSLDSGINTSDATATSADLLEGKSAYANDLKIEGTMRNLGTQTITPSTEDREINQGYVEKVTIIGDKNLIEDNIKKGITLFGIEGSLDSELDTSDATASANDILKDKTAYVNGEKIIGLLEFPEEGEENAVLNTTLTAGKIATGSNIISAIPSIIKKLPIELLTISDTSAVALLANCTALEVFPNLDLTNITDASYMCYNCISLNSIPQLDTSKIINGAQMLRKCSNITAFQDTFDFSSATDISSCFSDCTSLIEAPTLIIGNTNLASLFSGCTKLKKAPTILLGAPTHIGSMFAGCSSLENVTLTCDLTNVKTIASMFSSCTSLKIVDLQSVIGNSTLPFDNMFYNCTVLEEVVNLDTSKMTTCLDFFRNCRNLIKIPVLDCSSMNYTANRMFQDCTSLENVNLINITNKLTRIEDTFKGCTNLKSVSMTGDLSGAYSWSNAFSGCTSLETLNIDFSGATSISFYGCTSLKNVNMNFPKATSLPSLFNGCTSIEDITSLTAPKVTNISYAFKDCSNLKHVPVLDTSLLTGSGLQSTFYNCPNLTDESLNNILQMCVNAIKITSNKTLKYIGLTEEQAIKCSTLSNYQTFIEAGWVNGYTSE